MHVAQIPGDFDDARDFFAEDEVERPSNLPVPEPSSAEPVGAFSMPRKRKGDRMLARFR